MGENRLLNNTIRTISFINKKNMHVRRCSGSCRNILGSQFDRVCNFLNRTMVQILIKSVFKSLLKTKYTGCPYEGLSDNGILCDRKLIQFWKTLAVGNLLVSMSRIMKLCIARKLKLYKLDKFVKNINFNFGAVGIQFQIRVCFAEIYDSINHQLRWFLPDLIYIILRFLGNLVKMNQCVTSPLPCKLN